MSKKIKFSPKGFLDFFGKTIFDIANTQNHTLELNGYVYKSEKLPEEFNGFRIIHLSDLHNCVYGYEADELIKIVKRNKPDIIVITGDSFDSRRRQYFDSLDIIKKLTEIEMVLYVTGNHEELSPDLKEIFLNEIKSYGVQVLDCDGIEINRGGSSIFINGIADFTSFAVKYDLLEKAIAKNLDCEDLELLKDSFCEKLRNFAQTKPDGFNILLSHRPEMFDAYAENGYDLVFCGHAHGGQFRIPPIGPIYSPGQGFLPKFSEGPHTKENTTMIVSRGLGNSSFPLRINNRPQILVTELRR